MKFESGRLVATSGITNEMSQCVQFSAEIIKFTFRHLTGDYGESVMNDEHDYTKNESSIENGEVKRWSRILSRYESSKGSIYIITERAKETITTILFTSEY